MKNLKRYCNVLLLMTVSAALSLSGCREVNDTLYLKYVDIPSEGWQTYQPVCFDPAAADTLWLGKPMILEMHVRYRPNSPMPSLPLLCEIEDENGEIVCDTLHLQLFDKKGRPGDKAIFGICESSVTLAKQIPLTKGLSVCLTPLGPKSASKGLMGVGIKMSHYGLNTSASGKQ